MGKEGPCCHCGIECTPLWRNGPREKPVLCNACGSRWRTRGTLRDYIPKHAMKEPQNIEFNGFPSTEVNVVDYDHNSGSSSSKSSQEDGPSELNFENHPKRRRSVLAQYVLSPVARLNRQLLDIAREQPEVFFKTSDEDVLLDQGNNMISPCETLLGAMLLSSPPRDRKPTRPESSLIAKTTTITTSESAENVKGHKDPPPI